MIICTITITLMTDRPNLEGVIDAAPRRERGATMARTGHGA